MSEDTPPGAALYPWMLCPECQRKMTGWLPGREQVYGACGRCMVRWPIGDWARNSAEWERTFADVAPYEMHPEYREVAPPVN